MRVNELLLIESTVKYFDFSEWKTAAKKAKLKVEKEGELANVVSFDGTKQLKITRWTAGREDSKSGGEFFKGPEWNYGTLTLTE